MAVLCVLPSWLQAAVLLLSIAVRILQPGEVRPIALPSAGAWRCRCVEALLHATILELVLPLTGWLSFHSCSLCSRRRIAAAGGRSGPAGKGFL